MNDMWQTVAQLIWALVVVSVISMIVGSIYFYNDNFYSRMTGLGYQERILSQNCTSIKGWQK